MIIKAEIRTAVSATFWKGLTLFWKRDIELQSDLTSLAREFNVAEQTYGIDHLDLVLATGLLRNRRVVGYLVKHYQELLFEFQKLTDAEGPAVPQ